MLPSPFTSQQWWTGTRGPPAYQIQTDILREADSVRGVGGRKGGQGADAGDQFGEETVRHG